MAAKKAERDAETEQLEFSTRVRETQVGWSLNHGPMTLAQRLKIMDEDHQRLSRLVRDLEYALARTQDLVGVDKVESYSKLVRKPWYRRIFS